MKYFITEDIYLIKDKEVIVETREEIAEPKSQYNTQVIEEKSGTCVALGDLNQKSHATLEKILSAIKITDPDFTDKVDLESGHERYLIFGDFEALEKYMPHERNGVKLLISDELNVLDTDLELKKKLWPQLQLVFLS